MLFRFKHSAKKMHVLIGFESCFNTDKELAQAVDIMMAERIYISLIKDKQKNKITTASWCFGSVCQRASIKF